jgi:hypothetical protein
MSASKEFRQVQIQKATAEAFDRLTENKEAYVSVSISQLEVLSAMRAEIKRKASMLHALNLFLPHGEGDDWKNVKRATFFGKNHIEHLPLKRRMLARAFSSRVLPETLEIASDIAKELKKKSQESSIPDIRTSSLVSWNPNRFGINRLDGSKDDKAVIAEHTDVKTEIGTVVVFEIAKGSDAAVSNRDNMTFIFSQDICEILEIDQPLHGEETDHYRLSLTMAELNPALS